MKNHIEAVLWKQVKDTFKNKEVLIQFLMFPLMTVIMENSIEIAGMPEHFFANLFGIMYVGMAPLTATAAIIAEEKEKNTLRVLQMCNVKATEYLVGNGIYIVSACAVGSLIIGLAGGYKGSELLTFIGIMLLGHVISFLAGAAIGVISKSQMMATALTMPVMMIFAFLPMLAMFNETIGKGAKYVFSQQLYLLMNDLQGLTIEAETGIILAGNITLIVGAFLVAYRERVAKESVPVRSFKSPDSSYKMDGVGGFDVCLNVISS